MVKNLEQSVLKVMNLSDLKKHAKNLRREGYQISGYKSLSDTKEDKSKLRKMIRKAQTTGSTKKPASPEELFACNPEFTNITQCKKHTDKNIVEELAESCHLDMKEFNTKEKRCVELMKLNKPGTTTGISNASPKSDEYKKLNNLTKPQLIDIARELKINWIKQGIDGNLAPSKALKINVIKAIIAKRGQLPLNKKDN